MINNQSDVPEKFEPKDSEQKEIKNHQDDENAVKKPKDENYRAENRVLEQPEKRLQENEQPITPDKQTPKI